MVTKRFAEGTTVSVESSRGEISGILAKHGVIRQAWASESGASHACRVHRRRLRGRGDAMTPDPRPLSAEEEATVRRWNNLTATTIRIFATLDAERARHAALVAALLDTFTLLPPDRISLLLDETAVLIDKEATAFRAAHEETP